MDENPTIWFDKLCSAIIISEEFGSMKPDLAIFNEATQQAGYALSIFSM